MQPEIKEIACPNCSSKQIKKHGIKKKKLQTLQRYFCKSCQKTFNLQSQGNNKTYPIATILNSISLYNLGHSQAGIIKIISKKYKIRPSQKTISNWLNEYENICTYSKLRKEAKKLYGPNYNPEEIIETYELMHNNLPYKFQIHKAKLYLLFHNIKYNNQFHNISMFYEPLKAYLEKIPTDKFPHNIFTYNKSNESTSSPIAEVANNILINENKNNNNEDGINAGTGHHINDQRASQLKFEHLKIKTISKNNFACKLANLALNLAATNKERHQAIQDFMLINDSTTIAVEMPIYLTNWDAGYYRNQRGFIFPLNNYKTPITGHIDILQIRNGLIHILDYKPEADKINATEQLTIYALALSRKLNLPLYHFKTAWFDESNYYEFFPLHAVYEKR